VTYRVILAAGATAKFHNLPEHARDALVSRAADLIERAWDDVRVLPGGDQACRGTTFGDGRGMLEFHVDDGGEIIRIFEIVWLG
jgi:hypothetical protein